MHLEDAFIQSNLQMRIQHYSWDRGRYMQPGSPRPLISVLYHSWLLDVCLPHVLVTNRSGNSCNYRHTATLSVCSGCRSIPLHREPRARRLKRVWLCVLKTARKIPGSRAVNPWRTDGDINALCCRAERRLWGGVSSCRGKRSRSPLKGNYGIFKPRPYFWHEIRSSTHREQFGESRRPSEDI